MIRLEDGDNIPACLETFAEENKIRTGLVTIFGGISKGRVVTGPRQVDEMPPDPIVTAVEGVHEVIALGLLAAGSSGRIQLHLHGALGRSGKTITGCLRPGVETWLVGEVVICEILGVDSKRLPDNRSGFDLLEP